MEAQVTPGHDGRKDDPMNAPDLKTALPGPKAAEVIARDKRFVSPSYTRG